MPDRKTGSVRIVRRSFLQMPSSAGEIIKMMVSGRYITGYVCIPSVKTQKLFPFGFLNESDVRLRRSPLLVPVCGAVDRLASDSLRKSAGSLIHFYRRYTYIF